MSILFKSTARNRFKMRFKGSYTSNDRNLPNDIQDLKLSQLDTKETILNDILNLPVSRANARDN